MLLREKENRGVRLRIPDFIQSEIDYIKKNANMTPREEQLFDLRNREFSLEECAYQMNCSLSTVNRINKNMKRKILKVI